MTGMASPMERVRRSCEQLVALESCAVRVQDEQIEAFLQQLDGAEFETLATQQQFPLAFKSVQDEANFLTLYSLLSFGSGFRKELHRICDRGANDMISFGLIGMYISVSQLDAKCLRGLTLETVGSYFGLPLDRDEEISIGIYISKPGPLKPLAEMIHKALVESGELLLECGFPDFGAFVMAHTRKNADSKPSAAHLVEELVSTFPAFGDQRESRGAIRYFYKRAQLAAMMVHRRFQDSEDAFKFCDADQFTALTDNVIPCVLNALGILQYDEALQQHIARGEHLPAGDWECDLRAATVIACDRIVAAAQGRLSILELDTYLWRVGKEARFRPLERHATRDTFFY